MGASTGKEDQGPLGFAKHKVMSDFDSPSR